MKRIWSGLKDKNGKKIMTGDTVKSNDGIDIVRLENGYFYPMGEYCARSGFLYDPEEWEVLNKEQSDVDQT